MPFAPTPPLLAISLIYLLYVVAPLDLYLPPPLKFGTKHLPPLSKLNSAEAQHSTATDDNELLHR